MSRLIDADATIPMIKYATTDNEIGVFPIKIGYDDIVKVLNAQPTVDAEPVKHGRWNETKIPKVKECSCCHAQWGTYSVEEFGYCPTCGAKMDERKEK